MNRKGKMALACVVVLLAVIPLNMVLSHGSGLQPTNDEASEVYMAQTSTTLLPEGQAEQDAQVSPAPADDNKQAAAKDIKLEDAIEEAAKATSMDQAAADGFANDISASADQTSGSSFAEDAASSGGTALSQALNSLNSVLTSMPADLSSLQEKEDVASIKSELGTGMTDTATATDTPANAKITDIQNQLDNISKLVSGDTTNTDATEPANNDNVTNNAGDTAQAGSAATNTETPPQPGSAPTPTPSPAVQASAHEPELPPEEVDQDIDDETALITLDIVAIPPAEVPSTASAESASIEAFIEVALAQVGKPYSTGGKGPDRFDCSGFVFYSLNTSGYSLGYMTSATWAGADFTTIDSIDDMKRGDIICLRGHVAIYLGDGVMVDASSKNGKIVVRDVGGWCRRNFRNAKRIWNLPAESSDGNVKPKDIIELNIVE